MVGENIEQNCQHAETLIRQSAEQGDALGQNILGGMYEEGKCIPKDVHQEIIWYSKAAAQNLSNAELNLNLIKHQLGNES